MRRNPSGVDKPVFGKIPAFHGAPFIFILQLFSAFAAAQAPPNVLFILVSEQDWGDLHCHGNDSLSTPNLDRLAAESVEFDRFYVDPAGASTRASLLTGRYALRAGVCGEAHRLEVMRTEEMTMAEVYRRAGYRTALFGEWDNGAQFPNDPAGQGFDAFLGFFGGDANPLPMRNRDTAGIADITPDLLTDSAIEYISAARQRPFFCLLAFDTPRNPCKIPAFYLEKYKKAGLTDQNAATCGAIENIDDNLGKMLRALDSLGIRDNTFIVFTSDGGPGSDRFNAGLRGQKGSFYEGGIRVPCFIHRSNYLAPRHMPKPAAHIDLLPTLTGLCEFPLPASVQPDGVNFSRVMQGAPDLPGDRMLFFHFSREKMSPYPGAVRAGRFAFILRDPDAAELYNVRNDPAQTLDLADSLPEITALLKKQYLDWYANVAPGDNNPPPVPVGGRKGDLTFLPTMDCDTTTAEKPKDNIPEPGVTYQDFWMDERDPVIWWRIDVPERGAYAIFVQYACDSSFTGGMMNLVTDGSQVHLTIPPTRAISVAVTEANPCGDARTNWKYLDAGMDVLKQGLQTIRLYLPYDGKEKIAIKGLVLKKLSGK